MAEAVATTSKQPSGARRRSDPALNVLNASFLPPPSSMKRAVTTIKMGAQLDQMQSNPQYFDELVASLKESAQKFEQENPESPFFDVGIVGCQRDRLETPCHFFLSKEVTVGSLRTSLAELLGIEAAKTIRLLFAGKWLHVMKTLNFYGIQDDSQLVAVFQEDADATSEEKMPASGGNPEEVDLHRGVSAITIASLADCFGAEMRIKDTGGTPRDVTVLDIYRNLASIRVKYRHDFSTEWIPIRDENGHRFLEGTGQTVWNQIQIEKGNLAPIEEKEEKVVDPYDELELKMSDEVDMITHEALEEEPRFVMPCGHCITRDSLIQYATHEFVSEKVTVVKCPYILEDTHERAGQKCGENWEWPLIRFIVGEELTEDERHKLELQASYNHIETTLNAQKCNRCGLILYRDKEVETVKSACPNCSKSNAQIHFCWACQTEFLDPTSSVCTNQECPTYHGTRILHLLQNCERKTIGSQHEIPSVRACVKCGWLIYHTEACKHMHCSMCKTYFCFVCLLPQLDSGWQCGSHSSICPNGTHPPQGASILKLIERVRLDLNYLENREREEKEAWGIGDTVEFASVKNHVRVWQVGSIVDVSENGETLYVQLAGADGGQEEKSEIPEDDNAATQPAGEIFALNRFGSDIRPWMILKDFEPEVAPVTIMGEKVIQISGGAPEAIRGRYITAHSAYGRDTRDGKSKYVITHVDSNKNAYFVFEQSEQNPSLYLIRMSRCKDSTYNDGGYLAVRRIYKTGDSGAKDIRDDRSTYVSLQLDLWRASLWRLIPTLEGIIIQVDRCAVPGGFGDCPGQFLTVDVSNGFDERDVNSSYTFVQPERNEATVFSFL